ncbi:MAG: hypothetical protein IJU20_07655 [Clostridia bacterium]|nr:hypothetical protein [Clostridia bacterium]
MRKMFYGLYSQRMPGGKERTARVTDSAQMEEKMKNKKGRMLSFLLAFLILAACLTPAAGARGQDTLMDGAAGEIPDYIGRERSEAGVLVGDPTGDGRVDRADAQFAVEAFTGDATADSGTAFFAADANGDNRLGAADALLILEAEAGRREAFPEPELKADFGAREDFEMPMDGLAPGTLYTMSKVVLGSVKVGALPHDQVRFVVSFQGLLNRYLKEAGVGFVVLDDLAKRWIPYIREYSDLLEGMEEVKVTSFANFLEVFEPQLKYCGLVVWDPLVPSTANVAATMCAVDGYLPVKYDTRSNSIYNQLIKAGVEVKANLCGLFDGKGKIAGTALLSCGSSKCDAYLWALDKYAARCADDFLFYLPDGASSVLENPIYQGNREAQSLDFNRVFNHDYGIWRGGFFFDLSPIATEVPGDDPEQPMGTDVWTLRQILLNRYGRAEGRFGEVVGFPPWWLKYSTHNGWGSVEATSVESTFTMIIGQYNCYMDADGSLADCSLYAQFPLADRYEAVNNHREVTEEYDPNTVYLYMYTGDYDSSPWVMEHMIGAFDDPARGTIPITWCFAPGLSRRVPMALDYLYRNQGDNDYFAAANNGLGYTRPQALFRSESERTLPDGGEEWTRLNREYFERFDLDSVGFIIGKLSDPVCEMYNTFAPVGSGTNDSQWTPGLYEGTPYLRIKNGIGTFPKTEQEMSTCVSSMYDWVKSAGKINAAGFRTITYKASEIAAVQEAFLDYAAKKDPSRTYKFVDYRTYYEMLAEALDRNAK